MFISLKSRANSNTTRPLASTLTQEKLCIIHKAHGAINYHLDNKQCCCKSRVVLFMIERELLWVEFMACSGLQLEEYDKGAPRLILNGFSQIVLGLNNFLRYHFLPMYSYIISILFSIHVYIWGIKRVEIVILVKDWVPSWIFLNQSHQWSFFLFLGFFWPSQANIFCKIWNSFEPEKKHWMKIFMDTYFRFFVSKSTDNIPESLLQSFR